MFDWVSGTAMIPYAEKLPEDIKQSFIETYKEKLRNEFKGSRVFFPFKRTQITGTLLNIFSVPYHDYTSCISFGISQRRIAVTYLINF